MMTNDDEEGSPLPDSIRKHRRLPETTLVPLSRLEINNDTPLDSQYSKLYQKWIIGEISSALTRIDEKRITSGFFAYSNHKIEHLVDKIEEKHIAITMDRIRSGATPPVSLYWNSLNPKPDKFVCPDDQVTLEAYRRLGVRQIPCDILKPRREDLEESAIIVRRKNDTLVYEHCMSATFDHFPSFFGDKQASACETIEKLITYTDTKKNEIISFHCDTNQEVHYHESLFAYTHQHARCLRSMRRLIEIDSLDHAYAILRLAYERFLSFYVDWLCPHVIAPRMQYHSRVTRQRAHHRVTHDPKSTKDPETISSFYPIFESVQNRANISPLGDRFHRIAYPAMSFVVHQDYETTVDHASFDELVIQKDPIALIQWTDIITASLLCRVSNEIGKPFAKPK